MDGMPICRTATDSILPSPPISRMGSSQWWPRSSSPTVTEPNLCAHGHHRCFHVSCRLAVSDARLALSNFYNITIRIANVAAGLAVLLLWLREKLGSPTSP